MSYVSTTVGPGGAALLAGTQTFTGANTFLPTADLGTGPVTLFVRPAANTNATAIAATQFTPTAIFGDPLAGPFTTRVWATGLIPLQAEYVFTKPTYAAVGASTMATAATLAITGSPIAGANMIITNSYALNVVSGTSRFDGDVICGANVKFAGNVGVDASPATIDQPSGRFSIATGASTATVTNNLVTANSIVICTLQTVDGGFTTIRSVVPAAGSFTITGNAVVVGATVTIGFIVINPNT